MGRLSIEDKINILHQVNIFSETSPDLLGKIATSLEEVPVLKGKKIIEKGTVGDAVYILFKGKVRIHDGNHVLARLETGEVFGEYALIDKHNRSASVTAEENCLLLKLNRTDFYRVAEGNIEILRGILKVLIKRIRDMNALEEKLSKSYLKIQKQKDQIEKQHSNIIHQKEQLELQNYDLIKLNEEKNHFISVLIHGLKNPLTSSLCLTEMMESGREDLNQSHQEYIQIVRKSLRRINNLVNEILDVNAIDSKVYKLKYENIKPRDIITELIENYQYTIEQKNITLTMSLQDINTKLNRVYFTQIVDNLLSNAVKFTPQDKSVDVRLYTSDGKIIFSISDEGPGIHKERLKTIFDEYKRQRTMEEQEAPSTGLGLAIVYKYVSAMKGTVSCESDPETGTSFIVEFDQE